VVLDLRLVRYFTIVAEHGNFGRAAAALHLAQPSLSRQIQRLEEQLGARLLDRTPQGSHLTEAGRVFLPEALTLLRCAHQAAAKTRAAARTGRITVGYTSNLIVTPAVRELRRQHPDADVPTLHLDWNDTHTALLDHRVDAAVAREPFPTDRLRDGSVRRASGTRAADESSPGWQGIGHPRRLRRRTSCPLSRRRLGHLLAHRPAPRRSPGP
jgi:DNA-binding transcriptional LysR family regulator